MDKATLLYDADCPLWRRAATWAFERARNDLLAIMPCRSDDRMRAFPDIDEDTCEQAPQLVMADGRMYSGDALIPPLLDRLKRWHMVGAILCLPGINQLAPFAYRTLARNRKTLSVLMYRK
jgi:predicted DCC family thiol-disulfide oxidoreductase YuxK